jgi:hypothetical protein
MISKEEFNSLVATYEKYGWQLRRVVVRDANGTGFALTQAIELVPGVVDAAWFSRPAKVGTNAWEIRYLGPTQFAFVDHLDENSPDFEDQLHQTEQRLADIVAAKAKA